MAADLTQAVGTLLTNIRNLASDDSYKIITGVFNDIPKLKGLIESKDTELGNLKTEITELESRYESRLQENLELYRTQQNKLEEEKVKFAGTISALETTIQQKDAALSEHARTRNVLRGQLDQVTKLLGAEKDKVAAVNADITKLEQSIKGKDAGIDNLKDSLRNEKAQNSKAKSMIQDLRKEMASLKGDLQLSTTRLDEIEGFTTKLQEVDETVW